MYVASSENGVYAAPAHVFPHFLQLHIPVDILYTVPFASQNGHVCFAYLFNSTSLTLFLRLTPYLAPYLPAGPTTFVLPILGPLF